jgi:hypothetical protein
MAMKEKIAKRHKQASSNRDLGKYLKYALGQRTHRQKPPVLVDVTAEGTKVYGGKQRVEEKEKELTEEHFGKNRERWYHNAQGAVLPRFRSTKQERQWRNKLAAGALIEEEWKAMPSKLRGVLRCARAVADREGDIAGPRHYGDIFTSPISMQRLKRWLARKKKNTAPGIRGIRVDHLAAAPTRALRAWARMLSMPYVAGCMYGHTPHGRKR